MIHQVINATISHELSNPLNSIMAELEKQRIIHSELEALLQNEDIQSVVRDLKDEDNLQTLISEWEAGNSVMKTSSELMDLTISYFLDYGKL